MQTVFYAFKIFTRRLNMYWQMVSGNTERKLSFSDNINDFTEFYDWKQHNLIKYQRVIQKMWLQKNIAHFIYFGLCKISISKKLFQDVRKI